jgi:2,4-dienoyl-CoA reductase (NADPH2)
MKPDVVVLALGGAASSLEVSGTSGNIILDRDDVQAIFGGHASKKGGYLSRFVSYLGALFVRYFYKPSVIRWLLRFNWPFKKRIVVVGGNFAGCELAETLVDRGKEVTIIEESGRLGSDIELTHRWVFLAKLRKAGAKMLKEAKVVRITNKGVEIMHAGSTAFTEADTVVNVGITANTSLAQELEGRVPELHLVGDCAEPGKLMEAIASGFRVGQSI